MRLTASSYTVFEMTEDFAGGGAVFQGPLSQCGSGRLALGFDVWPGDGKGWAGSPRGEVVRRQEVVDLGSHLELLVLAAAGSAFEGVHHGGDRHGGRVF